MSVEESFLLHFAFVGGPLYHVVFLYLHTMLKQVAVRCDGHDISSMCI